MQRTPYWQIDGAILIDLLAIPVAIIFCYGVYLQWRKIQKGAVKFRLNWNHLKSVFKDERIIPLFEYGILGLRVYRKPFTGLFHGMVFWGMLFLFLGTTMVFLNVVFGATVMSGGFYKWFMASVLDAAGLAVMIGIVFLLVRRLSRYPRLVEPKARSGIVFMELLLLSVILSGFFLEALRIRLTGAYEPAFVGYWLSGLLGLPKIRLTLYIVLWWTHGLLSLLFLAYLPYSPLMHLLLIPLNAATPEDEIGADVKALDLSSLESAPNGEVPHLGTPTLAQYYPKRLLDFSTCLWCGRCQEVCPATQTDKSLTPKGVLMVLAEWLQQDRITDAGLIDEIGMEKIFECRTCAACVDACPAMINPLKAIWSMRQSLMMQRGEMPASMVQTYRNMEALRHPFSSLASSTDWSKGLDVPIFEPGMTEYLLWIGCVVTYEDRAQHIGRAMVNILNKTGVSYGIIPQARCTGDPAKQMGDDYLFTQLANANIELFRRHGVGKIITMCPHCFNSFTKYYPPLGGSFKVVSHVHLINNLIKVGRLKLRDRYEKIAYHDPCYLGRHNKIFGAPREIIDRIGEVVELPRNCTNSFCCGAGGGNYWNDETGKRINYVRAQEAFEIGAQKIASACPFCVLMLTDGFKMYSDKEVVFDMAELIEQNIESDA